MRSSTTHCASRNFSLHLSIRFSRLRLDCPIPCGWERYVPICLSTCFLAADPVGQQLEGLETLMGRYRQAGLYDITHDFYAGGRHEMLNEINRDEVSANLLAWIFRVLNKEDQSDATVSGIPAEKQTNIQAEDGRR